MNALRTIFDDKEKVQVIHGTDFVLSVAFHMMDMADERIDIYADFRGPNIVEDTRGGIVKYIAAQQSGVKIRVITEITKENLIFCKENMRYIGGLRHMDRTLVMNSPVIDCRSNATKLQQEDSLKREDLMMVFQKE